MKILVLIVSTVCVSGACVYTNYRPLPTMTTNEAATLFVSRLVPEGLQRFRDNMGRYPTTQEGLTALYKAPGGTEAHWRGPYIGWDRLPRDPWNHTYQYRQRTGGANYVVWSLGPDGVLSNDDIVAEEPNLTARH